MSAKKLTITDTTGAVKGSFNVRYEKMDREDNPEVIHKVGEIEVKNRSVHDGVVLLEGMTRKGWFDDQGEEYQKEEIKHYFEGQEVSEKSATKVFEITAYQSLQAYTDSYVIDKYYELSADDDSFKKDFDRDIAKKRNLIGMRKLWEHLHTNSLVARAEFNSGSSGYQISDGYIRAVSFGNKWGLQLSRFKEELVFQHLEEEIPAHVQHQDKAMGPHPGRIKRI